MPALRVIEDLPRRGDQEEPSADECEAEEMERTEVRLRLPSEHHFRQVARIVCEPVDGRVSALQPTGEEEDRQRKSVHLRKQCDENPAERAKRAPMAGSPRLEKTVREKDEDRGVDDHEPP